MRYCQQSAVARVMSVSCRAVYVSNTNDIKCDLTTLDTHAKYRGRGSQVMSWILLKANNGQQASGVGDKRFFRFKRNAYHLWTAIIRRHRPNDITHQQVMRFNQGSKFANIFKVHLKHPQCLGTLAQPSHFLSNTPVHDTTDLHWARTCWEVMGQWLRPQWIPYMARVTQHLLTCGEQVTKIWSTNLHCADV